MTAATIILDDSGPINTMTAHAPSRGHVRNVPVSFLERFVEATQTTGMRGKFTLLPYPCGYGRLDRGIPDYDERELTRFLSLVRKEIAPRWDITPEILTHAQAFDIKAQRFLDLREDKWAETQNADGLTEYFVFALKILQNIGIPANGITSPWSFGIGVEPAYAEAVERSLREVGGLTMTWYFLHFAKGLDDAAPRIMRRGTEPGAGVVSVVGGTGDPFWSSQDHADAAAAKAAIKAGVDALLSPDGQSGRVRELAEAGLPIVIVTHWQSLFSNGHGAGLAALVELAHRMNEFLRVKWTTPSELARRLLNSQNS